VRATVALPRSAGEGSEIGGPIQTGKEKTAPRSPLRTNRDTGVGFENVQQGEKGKIPYVSGSA